MIQKASRVILVVIAFGASAGAYAQSAAEIFAEMDSRKRASIDDIRDITRLKATAGVCTLEYFEKETTASTDGRGAIEYMRLVPITEVSERNSSDSALANMSPAELDAAAATMRIAGAQMGAAFRDKAAGVGLPGGIGPMLMNPPADKPWLSADPEDMGGMYAMMFEGAADSKRMDAAERLRAEQEAERDPYAAVAGRTRVTGRETINGRSALKLITEDINSRQVTDGGEFMLQTMHLWVDADRYVPLKFKVEGIVMQDGESREISIGREDLDFQTYPGCGSMLEPTRSIMRMAGVMSPEEQAQMAEAGEKMAEFEQQLASMPAGQKEMIMRQMGPQLEMMRNMAAGNGIELVSEVKAMRCNTGTPANNEYMVTLPVNLGAGCNAFQSAGAGPNPGSSAQSGGAPPPGSGGNSGGSAGAGGTSGGASGGVKLVETNLARMIQLDLKTLGYDPGNTEGIMSRPTVVAITQFEAASGLEVTGRATPQLAGRLQAAVDALN